MKLLVATDAHIYMTSDGRYWCKSIYGYDFWNRYLEVFETVRIVARTKKIDYVEDKMLQVDGPNVEIYGIPFYQGPKQLLLKYSLIQFRLINVGVGCDAALLRMPSQTASMVWRHLRTEIPLAGEIVYDPTEDTKNENSSFINKIISNLISRDLAKFCMKANGVSYVTERVLQSHYPSHARLYGESDKYFETFYSTVVLDKDAYFNSNKELNKGKLTIVLSSVAMNSERKGEKILISALKKARDRGYNIFAIIIGDGTMRRSFEDYAKNLAVTEYITFTGLLATSSDVREVMLQADLYVFPSQGEGLPRGILEAMALSMPVIASPVGGIPEILDSKYLFDPLDVDAYANEICRLYNNPEELVEMGKENYQKAKEFSNDILQRKRTIFYLKLRHLIEKG